MSKPKIIGLSILLLGLVALVISVSIFKDCQTQPNPHLDDTLKYSNFFWVTAFIVGIVILTWPQKKKGV